MTASLMRRIAHQIVPAGRPRLARLAERVGALEALQRATQERVSALQQEAVDASAIMAGLQKVDAELQRLSAWSEAVDLERVPTSSHSTLVDRLSQIEIWLSGAGQPNQTSELVARMKVEVDSLRIVARTLAAALRRLEHAQAELARRLELVQAGERDATLLAKRLVIIETAMQELKRASLTAD